MEHHYHITQLAGNHASAVLPQEKIQINHIGQSSYQDSHHNICFSGCLHIALTIISSLITITDINSLCKMDILVTMTMCKILFGIFIMIIPIANNPTPIWIALDKVIISSVAIIMTIKIAMPVTITVAKMKRTVMEMMGVEMDEGSSHTELLLQK